MPWISGCLCCKKEVDKPKILYIFDFDLTIVQKNSEQIYRGIVARKKGVTEAELEQPPPPLRWEHMCQELVDYTLSCGVTMAEILQTVRQLPFVPGMDTVLTTLSTTVLKTNKHSRFVILSGANSLFITTKLATLSPPVIPNQIISNHGALDGDGSSFKYAPHSDQRSCQLCSRALCKGAELGDYFESHGRFDEIHFMCDGTNDMCPSLRLRPQDTVYVRSGFGLDNLIKNNREGSCPIAARIVYWKDGTDLLGKLLPEAVQGQGRGHR